MSEKSAEKKIRVNETTPAEQSVDKPVEQPAKILAEQPAKTSADQSVKQSAGQSGGQSAGQSAKQSTEQPAGQSAGQPAAEGGMPETVEGLRAEVETLRRELAEGEDRNNRMIREMSEFAQYFPENDVRRVPDQVWREVSGGVPLAAAYALFEHKSRQTREAAEESNRQNKARSAGALKQNRVSDYYTASEVRAMSRAEVRANYDKIVRSMIKW